MEQQKKNQGKECPGFEQYSGPIVDIDRVDQCEAKMRSHKEQQQANQWEPLGLDHQAGYLEQHSGYEMGKEKKTRDNRY